MKVIGFQLLSSSSPQKKHYTVIITDTGYKMVHYGGRVLKKGGSGGYTLAPGQTKVAVLNSSQTNDVYSVLNEAYMGKQNSREYDMANIITVSLELPDIGFTSEETARKTSFALHEKINTAGNRGIKRVLSANLMPGDLGTFKNDIAAFNNAIPQGSASKSGIPGISAVPVIQAEKRFTDVGGKIVRPNGEEYKPRALMGHTDVALLREFRQLGIFVRLEGPPGGGKTALVEGAFGDGLITITGHGDMTVANFVGTWMPRRHKAEGESEWQWVDGPLTRAMKEGKVLHVDEGLRIPTEVLNILFSAMDGRRVLRIDDRPDMEPIHAADGFYVIMGYNPDTLGARGLDEALSSRFRVQISVYTDFNTARSIGVQEDAIKIAQNMETQDREDRKNGGPGVWVPQMREVLTYRDLVVSGAGVDFALATLVAACPREIDIPNLVNAIKEVTGKSVQVPRLGGMV